MPRWLLALLVVSLVVLAVVTARPILFPPTNPRITRENWDRIKAGMTLKEVEGILGPRGDYRTGPTSAIHNMTITDYTKVKDIRSPTHKVLLWLGDTCEIELWFGPDELVCGNLGVDMEPDSVGLLDLLRWRWDRWRSSPEERLLDLAPAGPES